VRGAPAGSVVLLLTLIWASSAGAQIGRRLDRTQYSIHVDVASQVDLAELRLYLEEADRLLQQDQGAADVACCMSLRAAPPSTPPGAPDSDSLVVFGTPGDGLDVIDNPDEWEALGTRRAIVQTIDWCGTYNASLLGCATTPGNKLAVALDGGPGMMSLLIAHERGHNANLGHRSEACALMAPSISPTNGCLTSGECTLYRQILYSTTSGTCDCMGTTVGDPADANGSACTSDEGAGLCHHDGMCDPVPANDLCAAATSLTGTVLLRDDDYNAGTDGFSTCSPATADVWYSYTPLCTGQLRVDLCDSRPDALLGVQRSCAAGAANELLCSTNCIGPRPGCRAIGQCASAPVFAGTPVWLRVATTNGDTGPFLLRASCLPGQLLDGDGDGVPDLYDVCRVWPDPAQADADQNGIGDACECGDQTGDGRVDAQDLVAINLATFNPELASPLCDTTNDGLCDVRDIIGANQKIFGTPTFCARYPP
jgi:hypothetical protein